VGFKVVARFPDTYFVSMAEGADLTGECVVGFEAGSLDVGVEGGAHLSFSRVEVGLKGGFVGVKFLIEGLAEVGGTGGDFGVECFAVLMKPFFDQLGEFLIEGVLAGLIGEAGPRVIAELVFLRIDPSLETRV
jgi:hypothetical protein